MKVKIFVLLLMTSLVVINCGEKEINEINLKNAVFKATGNYPSWKLEIDSNNGIHFYSNSEYGNIVADTSDNSLINLSVHSYHATTNSNEIKIEIYRKQCLDSKKHSEFKYEVMVGIKKISDDEYVKLKGCGEFLNNMNENQNAFSM